MKVTVETVVMKVTVETVVMKLMLQRSNEADNK
jgi:hypothetical protein